MNILAAFRRFWYVDTIDAMQARMLCDVRVRARSELFFRRIQVGSRNFAKQIGAEFDGCFGTSKYEHSFQTRPKLFVATSATPIKFEEVPDDLEYKRQLWNPAKGRFEHVNER